MIREGGMKAAFQPVWDLHDKTIIAYEALARPLPGYGLKGPGEAFEIAARIGESANLDALCRRVVFSSAAHLPEGMLLFLNISPASLEDPTFSTTALYYDVIDAGLHPSNVAVEITERFSTPLGLVKQRIEEIRSAGFKVSLDDVGTGDVGIEILRQLPFDFVKIDRTAIARAVIDPDANALFMAVITYATQIEALVIVKGIEDAEMLEFVRSATRTDRLRHMRVSGAQGFLLGSPGDAMEPHLVPDALSGYAA